MKLIEDWKQALKLKSVQVGAMSAFFYALILFSEQFVNIWNVIPQDLKNKIPENQIQRTTHNKPYLIDCRQCRPVFLSFHHDLLQNKHGPRLVAF